MKETKIQLNMMTILKMKCQSSRKSRSKILSNRIIKIKTQNNKFTSSKAKDNPQKCRSKDQKQPEEHKMQTKTRKVQECAAENNSTIGCKFSFKTIVEKWCQVKTRLMGIKSQIKI